MFFPRFRQATAGLFVRALSLGALATPAAATLAGCSTPEERAQKRTAIDEYTKMCRDSSTELQRRIGDMNAERVALGFPPDRVHCSLYVVPTASDLRDRLCRFSCQATDSTVKQIWWKQVVLPADID